MAFLGVITRQPSESLPITIRYERALAGRLGTVGIPVVTAPSGVTVGAVTVDGTTATVFTNGGTSGQEYMVEVTTILTIDGVPETVQDEFVLVVQETLTSADTETWASSARLYDDALPNVLQYVQGCPDETAIFHIRQAAIEFFQKSLAWREELPITTTTLDQSVYVFKTPVGASVAKLLSYSFNDEDHTVTDGDMARSMMLGNSSDNLVWTLDRNVFEINPSPEDGESVRVGVALKPAQDSTSIPGQHFEHHIDAIAVGAIARILNIPKQSFTDHTLAMQMRADFEAKMNRAASAAAKSFSRSRLRVTAHMY